MRKMITAFKISIDGKSEGPQGFADWVDSWSDDYGLMEETDACIVGGRMYPGYETYWTAIRDEPGKPLPMSGKVPTKAELEWSRFAAKTSHYVLSRTLTAAKWANTSFLRDLNAVADLKKRDGEAIISWVVRGSRQASSMRASWTKSGSLFIRSSLAKERHCSATSRRGTVSNSKKTSCLEADDYFYLI